MKNKGQTRLQSSSLGTSSHYVIAQYCKFAINYYSAIEFWDSLGTGLVISETFLGQTSLKSTLSLISGNWVYSGTDTIDKCRANF